jgi:hypothetical protein
MAWPTGTNLRKFKQAQPKASRSRGKVNLGHYLSTPAVSTVPTPNITSTADNRHLIDGMTKRTNAANLAGLAAPSVSVPVGQLPTSNTNNLVTILTVVTALIAILAFLGIKKV